MPGIITRYFPELTPEQTRQMEMLEPLYRDWNARINVISRKDMDHFYEHHVLHSLAIARVIRFQPRAQIMDVGTGGGFPGIPLAIMFPESKFILVDSIGKKIKLVSEVTDALGLQNVAAVNARAEQLDEQVDFVISRAVTRMPEFMSWVMPQIRNKSTHSLLNGILYLKGGDLEEELKGIRNPVKRYKISGFYNEPFFETKEVVYVQA